MSTPLFQFSNVVVVDEDQIGVIVKTWKKPDCFEYEVYVRSYNLINEYKEDQVKHYIFSKELDENEYSFYKP